MSYSNSLKKYYQAIPRMRILVPILALTFVLLSTSAFSGQFEDAQTAYNHDNFNTAYQLLKPLADKGNARAQWLIGMMSLHGPGEYQSDKEAAKWFHKAIETWRVAADRGDAEAQFNLGLAYYLNRGMTPNYEEALKWFRKAAKQGHAGAQGLVGQMYEDWNRPLKQDWAEAYFWFKLAAKGGDTGFLDYFEANDTHLITPQQKAAVDERVAEWLKAHPAPAAAEKK